MDLAPRLINRAARMGRDIADIRLRRILSRRARPAIERRTPTLDALLSEPVLIIVAHPDDEVIAAAGLLARAPKAGVICVSSGAPRDAKYARRAGFDSRLDYAQARRAEAEAALALLGREISPLSNLGIADQEAHLDLVHLAHHLARPLADGFAHVVTHAYEGGHPDHDSVAFAVHAACALLSRSGAKPPVLIEGPLYSSPGEALTQQFVPHTDAGEAVRLDLSPEEQELKRRMLARHVSQNLTAFHAERESFRLAPRYHFAAPPHPGDVGFNAYGWEITGAKWRRYAWRAMRELDLIEQLA